MLTEPQAYEPNRDISAIYTNAAGYVNPALWEAADVYELHGFHTTRWSGQERSTDLSFNGWLGLGGANSARCVVACVSNAGINDVRTWSRGAVDLRHRRPLGPFEVRGRAYLAGVATFGGRRQGAILINELPRQRRIYLSGADPYETFDNPFLRSQGALLTRQDVNYQAPGGAGLRGLDRELSALWTTAANVELVRTLFTRPQRHAFTGLSVALFGDAAWTSEAAMRTLADAGVGVRASHRVGPTSFTTRLDFPLLVSAPALAAGANAGDGRAKFRFVWSFEEAF